MTMKFWKKYHKWAGIILSVMLLLFALSGIALNHRSLISKVNISRNYLPSSYSYNNWNSAALRGSVELDSTTTLFYGNVGCWKYNHDTNLWSDFNDGFPVGIDNRKISKLFKTDNNRLFAGTLFGLYEYINNKWVYIEIEPEHKRICDIISKGDTLLVLTRSELGMLPLKNPNSDIAFSYLPAPENHKQQTSLFKTLWVLHSGEIIGTTGQLLVDAIALLFIFFSITGLVWYIWPKLIKRAKKKLNPIQNKQKLFRFSVKWHNKLGILTVVLLIFTTITGMFLRPPLLIAIASTQIKSIPNTMLSTSNAWYDQLRAIRYNEKYSVYLVSTNKGFYALTKNKTKMITIPVQAPVSVMGINVFEALDDEKYLIGSFNGMYEWQPFESKVYNYFSGKEHRSSNKMSRPIGDNMVTAYYERANNQYYIDYGGGATQLKGNLGFPVMPDLIKKNAPISLWNLSLEIHTGRIFQDFLGSFYILIVPLVGLATLILLISGAWLWWKRYKL
ncbi:PepSY domain-containing protein [Carboxylicivirga sp. N1Y90]|uniref:PepSY-associated TM helix domain-containing protein n=1 Tax=Carboxylicivirga fragile TaxID=3417571 RepID=UPI003D3491F0|nr:PepSY domain-containing protein [Marinilabiliaceae bacterium N1Y90]